MDAHPSKHKPDVNAPRCARRSRACRGDLLSVSFGLVAVDICQRHRRTTSNRWIGRLLSLRLSRLAD